MPYYRYTLNVPLSPGLVEARIREATGKRLGWWESVLRSGGFDETVLPPFLGKVKNLSFRVTPDVRYSRMFRPRIRGRISAAPFGSRLRVTMYLNPFLTASIGGVLSVIVSWLVFPRPFALIRAGTYALAVAWELGVFFCEVKKAKQMLENVIVKGATLTLAGSSGEACDLSAGTA